MKNKLLITLALTGLAGGLTSVAQAASSVTLYGLVDAGPMYKNYRFKGDGVHVKDSGVRFESGILNSSRIGLKGVEDLGGGNKVLFQFEQKVDLNDGKGGNWSRQAWVGLGGSWGTFTMGRQKDVADKMLDVNATRGLGKASRAFGGQGGRHDSLFKYMTPKFSGFSGGVAYARGGKTGDDYRNFWSTGARYDNGPIYVGVAYNRNRPADKSNGKSLGYNVNNWAIGASYDFTMVKLSAAYGQDKNGKLNTPGDAKSSKLGGYSPAGLGAYNQRGFKSKNYYLGATAPIGPGKLGVAWQRSSSNLGRLGVDNKTQNIFAAQYEYFLSKRTKMFAYGAYAKGLAYLNGFKGRELGVGLQHRF